MLRILYGKACLADKKGGKDDLRLVQEAHQMGAAEENAARQNDRTYRMSLPAPGRPQRVLPRVAGQTRKKELVLSSPAFLF